MSNLFIASGIFHPEPGGPATYLYELLPQLQARGWDVRLLTYGEKASMGGAYPYPVTRIERRALPVRMRNYAAAARPLMEWADVVYIHTLGLPLWSKRRAPRVVKIVGDLAWERAIRKGWITPTTDVDAFQTMPLSLVASIDRMNRAREARRMDGIIVPSEYLKRMVAGWGVPEEKIRVIYNALPPDTPTAGGMSQRDARARLHLPDAPTILTVGRILPWKGVDHLITAVSRIKDVRLIVAGDGESLNGLKAQAQMLGASDRITFLGRVSREQMPIYMKAADYVALYSGYEGLSHTLLESLRVGTPLIASDKGGNPEVVQHRVNGLLAPYVDVDALTETIREAIAPGMREKLAAGGKQVDMSRFDFGKMVDQTNAHLQSFVGR